MSEHARCAVVNVFILLDEKCALKIGDTEIAFYVICFMLFL